MLKLKLNRHCLSIFLVLFCLSAVSLPIAQTQRVATSNVEGQPQVSNYVAVLNVALYPYVPRLDQFKQVINAAWAQQAQGIQLNYVDWDGYSQDPPKDLDVFVFDGIFLDYFVSNGFSPHLSRTRLRIQVTSCRML